MERLNRFKRTAAVLALSAGFLSFAQVGVQTTSTRAISSVSDPGRITRDAALYDRIKQLDLRKVPQPSFEDDLSRLSSQESRYREKLPGLAGHPRLQGPIKRLSAGTYRRSS